MKLQNEELQICNILQILFGKKKKKKKKRANSSCGIYRMKNACTILVG
jgi:hypothetical protein